MTNTDNSLVSQNRGDARQINWWLMLIPVVGWALGVATFWVEVGIRPAKPEPAITASATAPTTTQAGHAGKPHAPRGNFNDPFFYSLQDYLDRDYVAPVIIGLAAAIYLLCAFRHRSLLCLLLGLLALNFALRELRDNQGLEAAVAWVFNAVGATCPEKAWEHFMTAWVYRFAAALVLVGAVFLRKNLAAMRADWRHTSWFLATFAAYAVCLIVQRRACKWGPSEQEMHRSLEEWTETIAHAMFVVSSLVAWRLKKPAQAPKA